jgi:acid phosphatase family membrane protein YuiD/uncharacterized protein YneF (UPF0154 family)
VVYNPYIVVPLATWAVAQVAKFGIAAFKGRIDLRYLYASGGMPSVHSAVVSTALLVDGVQSHLFGFSIILAMIVMYDSLGVRRAVGEQAAAINVLLDNLDRNRFKLDTPAPRLRVVLGHQPGEVFVGALTGIVLAGLFNYERLGKFGDFFRTVPTTRELWVYIAIFALLVVVGVIARWILASRYSKSKVMKQFRKRLFTACQTVGWVGLILSLFVYERASYLSWRLWPVLALLAGLYWGIWLAGKGIHELPVGLAAEADRTRKMKWLNFGRKSR